MIIDDAHSFVSSRGMIGNYKKPMKLLQETQVLAEGYNDHTEGNKAHVFVFSAFSEASAKSQATVLYQYLAERQANPAGQLLGNLAFTLGERRSVLPWKAAISATSIAQLTDGINHDILRFVKLTKARNIGFVFTGQGSQWCGMGRELIGQYPAYRRSLESAYRILKSLGACWSLMREFSRDANTSRVHDPSLSQPMTTAVQMALVDLLASWNIIPARVTGHSSGEIAAAYCAGALTQRSAIMLAFHRGRVASKLKDLRNGTMIAVGLSEEEARPLIAQLKDGRVNVSCVNSPSSITVSGDRSGICELLVILQDAHVFARELAVNVAYHSHHMEDIADEYLAAIQGLCLGADGTIGFYSSLSGKRIAFAELGSDYWVSNMVQSVQFSASTQNLLLSTGTKTKGGEKPLTGVDVLIEIGPHSALQGPIKQILQHSNASCVQYSPTLIRNIDAIESCHRLVAQLFVSGYQVSIPAVNFPYNSATQVLVDLPPYPWNHSTSFWAESVKFRETGVALNSRSDILGVKVRDSNPLEPRWRNVVRLSELPWIQDHVIQSNVVYPAAGFLSMAIEAECQHRYQNGRDDRGYNLREVSISHALIIPQDSENVETMVCLRPYGANPRVSSDIWDEFSIFSSVSGSSWTENCRGMVSVEKASQPTEVDGGRQAHKDSEELADMMLEFETECTTAIDKQEMYRALDGLGLSFGPLFANLGKARVSHDKCIAEVTIRDTAAAMPAHFEYPFVIHPATLDNCIHAVFPIGGRYDQRNQGTPLPTFIEKLLVSSSISKLPGHRLTVYAQSEEKDLGKKAREDFGNKTHSLSVFDGAHIGHQPSIAVKGLILTALPRETVDAIDSDESKIYYQTKWQPDPGFLSQSQIAALTCADRLPFEEADQARVLNQAAFYYAERALGNTSASDISQLEAHYCKYYRSLRNFCHTVHEGQLGTFRTAEWLGLNLEERISLCSIVSESSYGILLSHIGENLSGILRKDIEPLTLMMEGDRLERYYSENQSICQSYMQAATYVRLLGNKNPHLNVLEIGAGTGGATVPILEALSGGEGDVPMFANYDFTDLSPAFFEKAAQKTSRWSRLVKFRKLDIEWDPVEQGFEACSYDLIIAANVLHTTSCIGKTMQRVKGLLKAGGTLVLIELTVKTMAASLIFGTLPGWWVGKLRHLIRRASFDLTNYRRRRQSC